MFTSLLTTPDSEIMGSHGPCMMIFLIIVAIALVWWAIATDNEPKDE